MGLNQTVSAERVHIAFFGKRNAGKSSLVNAFTNQELSVVSSVLGTTTDPVYKSMELLPLGPVMIIDTPGIDDEGELGALRVKKTRQVLNKTDIAILVVDARCGIEDEEKKMISEFENRALPYIIVFNKCDLVNGRKEGVFYVSAKTGENIDLLKDTVSKLLKKSDDAKTLLSDIVSAGDTVVLVIPIDESAPKGRLILPQQQTIRELLECGCTVVATKDTEYPQTLEKLCAKPKLVITDSQVFGKISKETPKDVMLTSFSILFARYKGDLGTLVRGAAKLDSLCDGDKVLISEGCTHHRQCNDIGSVKIPNWIRAYTGKNIEFEFTQGTEFPEDLSSYALVIHCGGCMLNEKEVKYRIRTCVSQNVNITNYGVAIAHINGILARSLDPFEERKILE